MRERIRTRGSSPLSSHVLRNPASTMTTATSVSSRAATPAATTAPQAPPPPPKSGNCNSSSTDDDDNDSDDDLDVIAPPPRAALPGSAKPGANKTPSPSPQPNGSPSSSGRTSPPPPPPPTRVSRTTSQDNDPQQLLRERTSALRRWSGSWTACRTTRVNGRRFGRFNTATCTSSSCGPTRSCGCCGPRPTCAPQSATSSGRTGTPPAGTWPRASARSSTSAARSGASRNGWPTAPGPRTAAAETPRPMTFLQMGSRACTMAYRTGS
ncbi:hypothetical protein MCOR02_003165 [Pyricularia oryzae]|nr:hypothetical protein MCOR02_003165 [Pyricularia oryzae]